MRKRILSMLLVLVMVLGMLPAQVFATDTPTEPCITEGCTFGAGHEGNCSNYVAPNGSCTTEGCYFDAGHQGNCSNYVALSEPCETEGCTYGANHEGNCSNHVEPTADELAAQAVVDLIEERFTKLDGKVQIYNVGTTIGSHTGPGTVALFFWGEERKD